MHFGAQYLFLLIFRLFLIFSSEFSPGRDGISWSLLWYPFVLFFRVLLHLEIQWFRLL